MTTSTGVALDIYSDATAYNPATGQVTSGYQLSETIKAFVYQASAMQGAVSDRIVDQSELVGLYEGDVSRDALIYFGEEWYQVVGTDNILQQDDVFVFGLKRTEKPNVIGGMADRMKVLGRWLCRGYEAVKIAIADASEKMVLEMAIKVANQAKLLAPIDLGANSTRYPWLLPTRRESSSTPCPEGPAQRPEGGSL